MRIGILTFHRSINNGAFIQCYSLAKKIQESFPEDCVEVIDYDMPKINRYYSYTFVNFIKSSANYKDAIHRIIRVCIDPSYLRRERKKRGVFAKALEKMPLSNQRINSDNISPLFEYINSNYDIVICGSDAIWNYVVRGWPNPYYLDEEVRAHKLSYAASCYGMSLEYVEQDKLTKIKQILNSYDYIGTRDQETTNFYKALSCRLTPNHNCDPSLLLELNNLPIDKKHIEDVLLSRGFNFNKPSVCVMGDNSLLRFVKKVMGNNYQYVCVYNYCRAADVNLYDLSPFEWAYVFRYFSITFTTYFHGTLLSLKNGTPTICLALKNSYNKKHVSKVEDVLSRLKLEDLYFEVDYKKTNIDIIRKKAKQIIDDSTSFKEKVKEGIEQEIQSFETFYAALDKIISNGK